MEPNKDQLIKTIANGDNSVPNVLFLCLDGSFVLIQGEGSLASKKLDYIARWKTFFPRSSCVGKSASKDDIFLDNAIMKLANKAWKNYIKTGKTRIKYS